MDIVSLFAGCGGLDWGFERAGFNIVWANEYDESIHETYRLNHPHTVLNTSDIRKLSKNDIPDCDGIIGGPPCQSWSEGGKQLGIEDPRGQLFLDYIRIVKDKKPKFFLIENVQGILDDKHKTSLNSFMMMLDDAGYNITYELLNAADYKIPQDRFRVFFIGIRKDLRNQYSFPNAFKEERITLRKAIGDITEQPRYYADETVEGENPIRWNHDVYTGPYDAKYMARNRVRGWDETSFTMQAQARNAPQHPQAPKMPFVTSNRREFAKGFEHLYRRLSVRECARIQTFPDNFKFVYKDVKDGYKMVGNAVPPRLAYFLAIQMKKAFTECTQLPAKDNDNQDISIQQLIELYPNRILHAPEHSNKEDNKKERVLICLVKHDNERNFIDCTEKIYYTGRKIPTAISFHTISYFMPYIKGKGIKDLYKIKLVRIGTRKEGQSDNDPNDFRLVFEIEFAKQLFDNYKPIHLNVWHTFSETTIGELLKMNEEEEM